MNVECKLSLPSLLAALRHVSSTTHLSLFNSSSHGVDIHDASFYNSTSPGTMEQARDLANYHENAVFTDPELHGIG